MIQVAATPMIVKPKIGFSIESIVGAGSRSPARSEGSSVAHDESEACSSAAGSPLNPGSVSPPPHDHHHHHQQHHQQHQHQQSHNVHQHQQQHEQQQTSTASNTTVFKPSALPASAGYGSSSVAAAAAAAAAGHLAKGLQYVHEPLTPPPAHPHPHHPFAFAAAAAAAAAAHHFQPNPHHPQHQPTRDTYPLYPWLLSRHGRIFPHRFPGGEYYLYILSILIGTYTTYLYTIYIIYYIAYRYNNMYNIPIIALFLLNYISQYILVAASL